LFGLRSCAGSGAVHALRYALAVAAAAALVFAAGAAAYPAERTSTKAAAAARPVAGAVRDRRSRAAPLPPDLMAAAAVAEGFVDTAVRRTHTDRSYRLVTDSLRQGQTRAQWTRGNIPVVPVAGAVIERAKLIMYRPLRHPSEIGWLLVVSGYSFWIELVKDEQWRVDYWAPALAAAWLSPPMGPARPQTAATRSAAPGAKADCCRWLLSSLRPG
jgi:hypothetical protein